MGVSARDSVPRIKNSGERGEVMVFFGSGERNSSRARGGGADLASSGLAGMVFMSKSNSARSMLFVLRIEFGRTGWDEKFW